jgi:hypothetical protein
MLIAPVRYEAIPTDCCSSIDGGLHRTSAKLTTGSFANGRAYLATFLGPAWSSIAAVYVETDALSAERPKGERG